jgi:two-component system nitrate/nitrite sensor histidine kinase NarX
VTHKKSNTANSDRPHALVQRDAFAIHNRVEVVATMARNDAPNQSRLWELRALLEEFLTTIATSLGANAGFIQLFSPNSLSPQIISSVGLSADFLKDEQCVDLICGICGEQPLNSGIHSFDIGKCKARSARCSFGEQFKSAVSAPLDDHDVPGASIGTITLFFSTQLILSEHILKTLVPFTKLISASLEHNKLNRENRRSEIIAERQSIANEIHDSLAQTLMYARMRTNLLIEAIHTGNETMAAQYAHDLDETLESSQKTVRELITDFRCEVDPAGLLHALQILTKQFRERNNIALEYTNNVADLDLPLEHEFQVYYIVREALANIATHSGATHARLNIDAINGNYVFTIEDNGRGGYTFTPIEGHYGMMIMRERAARIGGEIKIESSEGLGTLVQLFFPSTAARVGSD